MEILIVNLLIPLIMIMFGKCFKNAPKHINSFFGYRTSMSMKNKDTWEFAHQHSGKVWVKWGSIMLTFSIFLMVFLMGKDENTVDKLSQILCYTQIILLVVSIIPTEIALRKNFDKDGNRIK